MSARAVTVRDGSGEEARFHVSPRERVLHAGLLSGAGLPHECATGTCGACRAHLEGGEVMRLWPQAPGAARFRSARDVLMCQVSAASDITLTLRGRLREAPSPPLERRTGRLTAHDRLTPEVGLFRVALNAPLLYAAGQFALIALPGLTGPRAYSMTTHAPDAPTLDFLVRRGTGPASNLLFREDACALDVGVLGPFGSAVFDPAEGRPFVAIAGGSGIAGVLGILDRAHAAQHLRTHPSHVYFGLRTPGAAYLLDVLDDRVAAAEGGLEVTVAFSDDAAGDLAARHPRLSFAQGLVHDVAAMAHATHPDNAIHYVAGPPKMVDAAMRMLVMDKKISPQEIRYDRFG